MTEVCSPPPQRNNIGLLATDRLIPNLGQSTSFFLLYTGRDLKTCKWLSARRAVDLHDLHFL